MEFILKLYSASSLHIGVADGPSHISSENDSATASFPPTTSASDLHSVDSSDVAKVRGFYFLEEFICWGISLCYWYMLVIFCKESGASSQSLPSQVTAERLGTGISEPSLTTRDALDKYQIVAQKVANKLCCLSFLFFCLWCPPPPHLPPPPFSWIVLHYLSIVCATYAHVLVEKRSRWPTLDCCVVTITLWASSFMFYFFLIGFFQFCHYVVRSTYNFILNPYLWWFQLEALLNNDGKDAEVQVLFFFSSSWHYHYAIYYLRYLCSGVSSVLFYFGNSFVKR